MTEICSRREFLKTCGFVAGAAFLPRVDLPFLKEYGQEANSILAENLIFLPDKTEECYGTFVSDKSLMVQDFPLHLDRNYNLNKPITILNLPSGLNFSFENFYYFCDPNGENNNEIVRATILPNTMGTHDLITAVLDRGQFDSSGKYIPTVETYKGIEKDNNEIYGEVTYWVGDGSIYPNKVFNLLIAFGNILKYQEANGFFNKGQVYSYIDLIQLSSSVDYFLGYNSSYMKTRAGGVCAGATALANALYRMAEKANTRFDRTYLEPRYSHDLRYPLGFFAPPSSITDTTVKIDTKGTWDFRIIPPIDCYISPKFCLIPNGVPTSKTSLDGLGVYDKNTGKYLYKSDVNLLLNVAFTKQPPKSTSEDLINIAKSYSNFRSSLFDTGSSSDIAIMSGGGQLIGYYKWDEKKPNDIIESIFPSVDLSIKPFSEEIESDPYLQEVFTLMQILNTIDNSSIPDVPALLRNSDWYRNKKLNGLLTQSIEDGIDQLGYTKVQGQPVQCIQWVNLLASLGCAESPIGIGVPVRGPNDLIPSRILEGSCRAVATSKTGGDIIADPKLKIEEIKSSNLFLIKNANIGHIGAFLMTKDVNGKRVILTTDANRENDGKIRLFTIEDRNFDSLLGSPPDKKIILVKNNS